MGGLWGDWSSGSCFWEARSGRSLREVELLRFLGFLGGLILKVFCGFLGV